ncbi:MAG: SRPBCC family protein [Acidimicrobiia bacterium]|nr:SRPBCC family protein [Acidimicrobiia bacterium]
MIRVAGQAEVGRFPEEVWAFLMDPANQAAWQTSVVTTRREPDEPTRLGTRYIETRRLFGKEFELTFEVVRFDPPRHSGIELISGPIRGGASYNLEAVASGTRLTFSARLDTGSFFRWAEPMLRNLFQRELDAYLQNLKKLVEHPAPV